MNAKPDPPSNDSEKSSSSAWKSLRRPNEPLTSMVRAAMTCPCARRSRPCSSTTPPTAFLNARPPWRNPPMEGPSSPKGPGTVIGRYKLLQKIGEGGMGVVYMAEQEEPVRRRVALKIIKLGMDTKQVVARFEAERQALALMDHPNIARVLDGGAHRDGPALLRHGTGPGRAHHRVLRQEQALHPGAPASSSSRSARPSNARIRRASFIATSSPRTSWSRCTTASRCPR